MKKEKFSGFHWSIEKWMVDGEMIDVLFFETDDGHQFRCTAEELDRILEEVYADQTDSFSFVKGSMEEN